MPAEGAFHCYINNIQHQWEIEEIAKITIPGPPFMISVSNGPYKQNHDMMEQAENNAVQPTEADEMN